MNLEQDLGAIHAHHRLPPDEGTVLTAINSSWQFAAIIQFCRLFGAQLGISIFTADSLERALAASKPQVSNFWDDLVPQLLSRGLGHPAVGSWERSLAQTFSNAQVWQRWISANPLEHEGFIDLSPLKKVAVLHALCEWIVHSNAAIRNSLSQQVCKPDARLLDLLLSRPLGEDAAGAKYYHLPGNTADLRVYKQLPGSGSNGQVLWAKQSTTLQQLQAWAAQLSHSGDSKEQELHAALAQLVAKQHGSSESPPPLPPPAAAAVPALLVAGMEAAVSAGVEAVPPPCPHLPACAQECEAAGTAAATPPPPPPPFAPAAAAETAAAAVPPSLPTPPPAAAAAAEEEEEEECGLIAAEAPSAAQPADAAVGTPPPGAAGAATAPAPAAGGAATAKQTEHAAAEVKATDAVAAAPAVHDHAAEATDIVAAPAAAHMLDAVVPAKPVAVGPATVAGIAPHMRDWAAAEPAAIHAGKTHEVVAPAADTGEHTEALNVKPAVTDNDATATTAAFPASQQGTPAPETVPTSDAGADTARVGPEVPAAAVKTESEAAAALEQGQAAAEAAALRMKAEAEAAARVKAEAQARLKAELDIAAAQAAAQQQQQDALRQQQQQFEAARKQQLEQQQAVKLQQHQQFEAARKQQLEQQQAVKLQQQQVVVQQQQEAARQQAMTMTLKQEQERRQAAAAAAGGVPLGGHGAADVKPPAAMHTAPPSFAYPGTLQPCATAGVATDKAAAVVPQQFTRTGRPRRAATVRGRKPQHGLGWSPLAGVLVPRRQKEYRPGPFRNVQRLIDVAQNGLDAIVIPGAHEGRGQAPPTRLAARPAAAAVPAQAGAVAPAGGVGLGAAGVTPPAAAAAGSVPSVRPAMPAGAGPVPGAVGMPTAGAPSGVNPAVNAFIRQLNPLQLQQFLSFPPAQQVAIAEDRMRAYMAQQQAAAQQAAAQEQQQQATKRKKPVKKRRGWKKKRGPDYSDEDAEYNIENDSDFTQSESSSGSSDDWEVRRAKRSKGRGRGRGAKKQKAEEPEPAARGHGMQMGRGAVIPGAPYGMAPGAAGRPGMPGYGGMPGGMPGRPGMAPQQLLQQQQLLHQQQQMTGQQGGMYRPGTQGGVPGQMGGQSWPQQGQQSQQQMLQQMQQMQGRQHMQQQQQAQQMRPAQVAGPAPQVTQEILNQVLSTLSGEERLAFQAIPDQARKMQYIIQLAQARMQRQQQQQHQQMRPQGMMQQQPQQQHQMRPQYAAGGGFQGQQGMMAGGGGGGVNLFTGVQPGNSGPRPGMQIPGGGMSALGPGMSAVGPGGVNATAGQNHVAAAAAAMFAAQQQQQQGMRPAGLMQHGQGGWPGMQQQQGGDGLLPDTDSLFS